MALTDAQWAAEVADVVAELIAGTITEAQASARLKTATEDWPTRTLSNADLAARISRFLARLNGLILTNGPPDVALGELPAYDGATDVPADTARSVVTSKVLAAQFMTEEQKLERHAFKLKPGEWRDWNLPDLINYGLAIGVYMQLCFDREATLEAEIIAAYPAPVDITTGWPT